MRVVFGFLRGRLWLWELSALAWILLLPYIMTAHGHLDWSGHALGRDFVNYWSAGQMVREHQVAPIFDRDAFLAAERRLFDPRLPFHFWSYPPVALFLVAPLGWLPYIPGLIIWSVFGVAVLVLWRRRPAAAGALLGLLIFKPQMALMLPLAVLAERRWTTMAAAAAVVLALLSLSVPVFGVQAWRGFLTGSLQTQQLMLTQGSGPFQWMMPTLLMSGRLLGLPTTVAMTAQAIGAVAAMWAVWNGWRSDADPEAKAALLMAATFLASPQAFNYDLIPAAFSALVLWRRDQSAIGQGVALMVWGLPILMIALQAADAIGPRDDSLIKPLMILAPLALAVAVWRLYRLCSPSPSLSASASTTGQLASNT